MTSEPSEINQSSRPRIDYFSSLPNELLEDIFEIAYTESPPSQPLSKYLFPFFEKHLYCKISLYSGHSCSLFLQCLSTKPYKGKLVRSLSLPSCDSDSQKDMDFLRSLLPFLPKLIDLSVPLITPLSLQPTGTLRLSRRLEFLAVSIVSHYSAEDTECIDLEQLADLESLPSLVSLELHGWAVVDNEGVQNAQKLSLSRLRRLRVEGPGAEDTSVAHLTARCPALRHLELHSTYVEAVCLYASLSQHPSSLESLSLSFEGGRIIRDHEDTLAGFTRPRSLHLGNHCYSSTIPSTLLKLPLLVEIHLGQGTFDFREFTSLVSGPTRLLFLKLLTFDCDTGHIGHKISAPSREDFDATRERRSCSVEMIDWRLPDFIGGNGVEVAGMDRFLEGAEENGITVNEEIRSALQTIEDYYLEANNRAVIAAFYKQLWSLRQTREIGRRAWVCSLWIRRTRDAGNRRTGLAGEELVCIGSEECEEVSEGTDGMSQKEMGCKTSREFCPSIT